MATQPAAEKTKIFSHKRFRDLLNYFGVPVGKDTRTVDAVSAAQETMKQGAKMTKWLSMSCSGLTRRGNPLATNRNHLLSFGVAVVLALPSAALGHAVSIGYENAGETGSVTIWLGTYSHSTFHNEGSLNLVGVAGNPFPSTTVPFNLLVTDKPSGLIDGVSNFYSDWDGNVPNNLPLVDTEDPFNTGCPDCGPVEHWQGVTFVGLTAGSYQFTYVPIANPSAEWDLLSLQMNGIFDLTPVVTGCGNPPSGCKAPGKALLLLKNDAANDSKDKLVFKWLKGDATTLAELGTPTDTTSYTLCLRDGDGTTAAVAIPAGANWKAIGTKGFKFKDGTGMPDGAQKAVVKSGALGKAKALVKGKGIDLPDSLVPSLPLPVTAWLINDENSTCFEAVFGSGDVIKNDAKKFKAKVK